MVFRSGRLEEISSLIATPAEICRRYPEAEIIDCRGMALLPSLADYHVHFRQPGYEYKETIRGGCEAAASGGYTTVCPMPNLNPAPDSPENMEPQVLAIRRDAEIEVYPFATITKGRKCKQPIDFSAMLSWAEEKGVRLAGFSDDGSGIQDEEPMRHALEESARLGFTIAAHCEVNTLLRGGYIHDGGYSAAHGHKGICSQSEWEEVERDIRLAEETGGRLHICHVSTKESVELVRRAKKRGVRVTCETGPHYLVYSDEDLQEEGRFKMNPPLRSPEDREALIKGVLDGTIDIIATDHAPHSAEEKARGLEKSAMGVVGLETAFPVMYTHFVKTGRMSLGRLLQLMSLTPRRIIYGHDWTPECIDGYMLANLDGEYIVDSREFHGHGTATPFEGVKLSGRVMMTILKGKIVYADTSLREPAEDKNRKTFTIEENIRIARRTWRMTLRGDTREFTRPGQFVNIEVPGKYLRRPISVADYSPGEEGSMTLLYDVVGDGTRLMSEMAPGERLDVLTALGNGFDPQAGGNRPVLLGGGIGAAPMLGLAMELRCRGKRPLVLLGFNTSEDVILLDQLKAHGIECRVATADGTFGLHGFVTDLYRSVAKEAKIKGEETPGYFYACGPTPMLKAICKEIEIDGELSLDERMGCGFGACVCCTVRTTDGPRRACADGPVFNKNKIIW